jgi:hypothetical protein
MIMSVERYIETLQLADRNLAPTRPRGFGTALGETRSIRTVETAPPNLQVAAVDVGSLVSFVGGVNPQERDDVLFSVQLAQRGASGAFDRFTQTQSWYGIYVEILETLGWTVEQLAFARYEKDQGELRMDKAALELIMAIATQNQLTILTQAVKALEALAEDDDTIELFDFHTTAKVSGNFQLGAVQKASNDALAMVLGAFHFKATDARRRFLFFSWGAQALDFWTAAQKMTLNTTLYARHRDSVQRKLGENADDYIAELTLG